MIEHQIEVDGFTVQVLKACRDDWNVVVIGKKNDRRDFFETFRPFLKNDVMTLTANGELRFDGGRKRILYVSEAAGDRLRGLNICAAFHYRYAIPDRLTRRVLSERLQRAKIYGIASQGETL